MPIKYRLLALLIGLFCHSAFALGVGLMMYSIFYGLSSNFFSIEEHLEIYWNAFLLLQFPILHSFFLSNPGRKLLGYIVPKKIRREMGTTLFAIVASVQLIVVFAGWSGSNHIIWQPSSRVTWIVLSGLYAASWLLLLKAMSDAGLSVQTGSLGWWSVFRNKKPVYPKFPEKGLNKFTRNPIYLSFSLILWTAPIWTIDRLILTIVWSLYCYLGPLFKEKRYQKYYGDDYEQYKKKVPYWFPWAKFH